MKILISVLVFYLLSLDGFAQNSNRILNEDGMIMNYTVNSPKSRIKLFLQTDRALTSTPFCEPLLNDSLGAMMYLENSDKARLSVRLRKDSLKYYRYSIIENDTSLIVNNKIPSKVNEEVGTSAGKGYQDMDLGISNVSNKKITVKIFRYPDTGRISTLIMYNKPLKPAVIWSYKLLTSSGTNNEEIQSAHMTYGGGIHVDEKTKGVFIAMKKTDIDFVYRIHIVRTSLDGSNIDFAAFKPQWKYDAEEGNPSYVIDAGYFNKPGDYKIYILPQFGNETNVSEVYRSTPQFIFKVLSVAKVYRSRDIIGIIVVVVVSASLIAGLVILIIKRRSSNKLRAVQKKARIARNELDQIRSQLNPHFVYNSLSGIQNLMNQKEVEKANAYLSKFARLTRNILDERERISLQDEHKLLDDYLAMERLRFRFNYEIRIDTPVNLLQVEIPAMLLQPFVENAVKHSMSAMRDKGSLLIEFVSKDKDLILSMKDNGKGFDPRKDHGGLGLKLCRKRIDLLNQVYTECPVSLVIDSGDSGTTVIITLNNWL